MTEAECKAWWADFKTRFPDMGGTWFAEGRSEAQQRAILVGFAGVLADVGLQESIAVNKAMERGDLEGFSGKWDRDEIARRVRKHAIEQRPVPSTWTGPNDADPFPQPKDTLPVKFKGTVQELIDMQRRGCTDAECQAYLRSKFPAKPFDQQRRYACTMCWDTGRVEVWHMQLVHLAKSEGIEAIGKCHYRTSSAACTCKLGRPFTERKIPLVQFDLAQHCRVLHGDTTSELAISRLREWLEDQVVGAGRSNHESAFDAYNRS